MEWLNYHHLLYFWLAAREGGVGRASDELRLAPSTVSAQIRALENALDEKLFRRVGRRLELTDMGRTVYRYADEIFGLGRELLETVKDRPTGRPMRLVVGVADVLPKLVARRLLQPAFALDVPVRLTCLDGKPAELLSELAVHRLDVVLADAPIDPHVSVRAFSHLLGECGVVLAATAALARRHRRRFPHSLDGAPLLVPTPGTTLRRSLDQWIEATGVRPAIVGEFADSALLTAFGQAGVGLFPVPAVVANEVCRQYGVRVVGALSDVRERFYAISAERRLKHPAVVAISSAARERLFD
jgi:LysR family transcriptional activator of nhaA